MKAILKSSAAMAFAFCALSANAQTPGAAQIADSAQAANSAQIESDPAPAKPDPAPAKPDPAPTKPDPRKAEEAYVAGAHFLERQEYAEAQAEFGKAARLDPGKAQYAVAADLTRDQRVKNLIERAARERMSERPAAADRLLAEARLIDPNSELLVQRLATSADQPFAASGKFAAVGVTPGSGNRNTDSSGVASLAGPIQLAPNAGSQELQLNGDPQQIVKQAASQYGIRTVFDEQVTGPPMRFHLEATPYNVAMPLLLSTAHLFAVPLDAKTILVAKDTQENRNRLERQVEETVYLPGSTLEQLNELLNIIKNVFDVRQAIASPGAGTLILRAPEATLKAVNYTLADLVDGGAEVLLRIQLVSVDKSHTLNTGLTTPTSAGAFSIEAEAQTIVSQNQTAVQTLISSGAYVPTGNYARDIIAEALALVLSGAVQDAKVSGLLTVFGGGLTFFGVNEVGGAAFNFGLNASEARALDDITVRVGDRQTTTLRIGSRYPITTSTYSSGISSSLASSLAGKTINGVNVSSLLSSASASTTPIIQFEDLGITLKAQPLVMKDGLVSLHVDLKLEALTGASANNIPVLTSRAFVSDLTVSDGGTAVMLSDLSKTEARSVSGIPGLAELPGLSSSAADTLRETDSSELILLVTPHVVRRRSNEMASKRIVFSIAPGQDN